MPPVSYERDGLGGGALLQDVFLRHAINLSRYGTHEARKLLSILDSANTQIKSLILKAKAVETKAKYQRIAKEIREITKELNNRLAGQSELDFKELADEEARFVEKALDDIGVRIEIGMPALTPERLYQAASFGSYTAEGHDTFETYLNTFSDNLYKTWDMNIRAAYLTGLTAKQITRKVLGSIKDADPGQMQALRNSLEMNTRTQISYMGNEARKAVYKANESIFNGYRRIETLDSRTCVVCGLADQKIYKTLDEAPTLPEHPNCRGLYLPVIKGMEEWRDDDERASVDGPVPAKTTWQDWLSKQPDDVVRDILGPTRFQLYKQGMAVTSFVSDGKALNLRQLVEKEGFELFGAGLKDKSWQFKNAYANTYYDSIRNRKNPTDIDKIAANSGLSQKDIRSIRDHLFIKEHDLGEGDYGRFSSNWQIAQAWQRMEQGWAGNEMEQYKAADILLLNHEREELTQMSKHGYNALQAHEIAESKYPWDIAIDKIDKVK